MKLKIILFFILYCCIANAGTVAPEVEIRKDTAHSTPSECLTVEKMRENGFKDTVVCGEKSAQFLHFYIPGSKDTLVLYIHSFSDKQDTSWTLFPSYFMHLRNFTTDTYAYRVHYPSGICPDITDTFAIDTFPLVHYPLLPTDTILCPWDTLHISYQNPDSNGYYTWNDLLAIGDSTASVLNRSFINDSFKLHDFIYVYPITYLYECTGYDSLIVFDSTDSTRPPITDSFITQQKQYVIRDTLRIYYAVKPEFSLMNDTVICRDSGYVLEALDINYLPEKYKYSWQCPLSEKDEESFYTADSGLYVLTVSMEQCDLSGKDSVYLEHVPLRWTDINLPPDTFLCDKTSLFLSVAVPHDSTLYLWLRPSDTTLNFDTVSTKPDIEITEKNAGTYTIILRDEKGCRNEQNVTITNDPCTPVFEAPNIITPNDDGINDLWKIKTADYIYNFAISIYDRYGVIVYKYKGSYEDFAWNGTYFGNGRAVPDGPYFYVITFKNAQGKNRSQAGSITVLR
ncbi:MAG: gliding motility-associated C-terminal domain-containing protein [Bacteroidales bacterium]|jgi:gliding motility-associated-like protein|nr:gliding motility-associated C-terminal domain-containing protein [Bacteroidales bacterium]